jgi:hypothetical protein
MPSRGTTISTIVKRDLVWNAPLELLKDLPGERWPDDVPVPSFGPRMVCSGWGIVGANASVAAEPDRDAVEPLTVTRPSQSAVDKWSGDKSVG